jgi:hypothetical protein
MEATTDKSTPATQQDIGLDRSKINSDGQIQLTQDKPLPSDPSDSGFSEGEEEVQGQDKSTPKVSKRRRISNKTKKILHLGTEPKNGTVVCPAPVLADAPDTVSDARLENEPPKPEKHTAKDLLHNPISTIQSKATGEGGHQVASNIVAKEISHGNEVELVKATERADTAQTERERLLAIRDVDKLLKARQDQFVRWTMDRHVTKLRILPRHAVARKTKKDFEVLQADGSVQIDWEEYAKHVSLYSPIAPYLADDYSLCNSMLRSMVVNTLATPLIRLHRIKT